MTRVKTTYKRFKYDFYPTPPSCVSAVYDHFDISNKGLYKSKVLDAGAGTGVWGSVLKRKFPEANIKLLGVELQEIPKPALYDYWASNVDFLAELGNPHRVILDNFDFIVSNPPFKHAEEFVRRSLSLTNHGGYVIVLVRLAFLESIKRGTGLFQEYPPLRVSVLSRRPSFHLDGKTGSLAYMVGLWRKGVVKKTKLDWLNWNYEESWEGVRQEARNHLENLGVLDEHLES